MKKLLVLFIILSIVMSVSLILIYNSPDVFIAITKPVNPEEPMYFEQIIIGGNGRFNLPVPQYIKERLNNINSKANEIEQEIFQKYETAHIETSIIIENGNTILIYSGSGINKETQESEKYNQEIVFDFIATRNIIADNQSVMTTIGTDTATEGESGFISSTLPNTTIQEDFESTISEKSSSSPALTSSKSLITSNELSTPQKLLFISNNNDKICSLDTTIQVMSKVNAYINSFLETFSFFYDHILTHSVL